MSKKGVSADEKRSRMLQLFYERGECFQLKELERIAPKEKGIIANSVKDVIQKLVEDGLVETDKIGNSVYFWAFPSKAVRAKKRKLDELQNKLEGSSKKLKATEQSIADAKDSKDKTAERNKILDDINDLEVELSLHKKKLKTFQDNDPERHKSIIKKINELKQAANRWTDNIFTVKSWCKNKFSVEDSVINKQFGIPEDLDYIE